MKNNKGIASIIIILIVVGVLVVGGYYYWSKNTQKQVACTEEAKICPDGSSVGRTGPNCEFAACLEANTSDWQTYSNAKYQIKYPKNWYFLEDACCPPPPAGVNFNNYSKKKSELSKHQSDAGVFTFDVLCVYEGTLDTIEEVKSLKTEGVEYSNLTINSSQAVKFSKDNLLTYYAVNTNSGCRITFSNDCEICKQILSTFKFLQ